MRADPPKIVEQNPKNPPRLRKKTHTKKTKKAIATVIIVDSE